MKGSELMAQNINELYQQTFSNVLVVVGIVFGLVGVAVPLIMAFFQSRNARYELEQIKSQVSAQVESGLKAAIDTEFVILRENQAAALIAFQERSDKVVTDLRHEMDRQIQVVKGGAFHIQALSMANAGDWFGCVKSACSAIPCFASGRDYLNLRTVCDSYAIENFKRVDAKARGSFKAELISQCEVAIASMEAVSDKGEFSDLIRELQHELNEFRSKS